MTKNVYIESLGCARNQVDSEIMVALLAQSGWCLTQAPEAAELIVVNTCGFIESAVDESIDTILALAEYKIRGKCRRLIVTGCLPERYGNQSAKALPEVDLFLGTGAYDQVVAAARGSMARGTCLFPDPDTIDIHAAMMRKPFTSHAAYLKIAEGCDRRCSFCVIPKLRGRRKSRAVDAIVAEARALIDDGAREITLVAQETTAYGGDLAAPLDLAGLLARLAKLDPTVWIRFLYGHPQTVTSRLMQTMARFDNICPYFDIPIQHAANKLLRRMGRGYTYDDLVGLFEKIRTVFPRGAIRTTVLVGFPGESEADVDQVVKLMDRVRFDHLGVFTYSDAEDLASHGLAGHVAPQVAQERLDRLMGRQRRICAQLLERYAGRRLSVMVDKAAEPGLYVARSMFQAPEVDGCVLIRSTESLSPGRILKVRIHETLDYDLIAEPDPHPRQVHGVHERFET